MAHSVVFITFATERYLSAAYIQHLSIKLLGYKHIIVTPKDLPENIRSYAMKNPRGYGFWRWKPYIIQNALKNSSDRISSIVYMDATIMPLVLRPLSTIKFPYCGKTIFTDVSMWCKPLNTESNAYINPSLIKKFFKCSSNVDASIVAFDKSPFSERLLDLWYLLCMGSFINDDYSLDDYHPCIEKFVDHRHDQTALALASFISNVKPQPNLSNFGRSFFYHHRKDLNNAFSIVRFSIEYPIVALLRNFFPFLFANKSYANLSIYMKDDDE